MKLIKNNIKIKKINIGFPKKELTTAVSKLCDTLKKSK